MRSVQLRHLRCLVAVAQERHLARAAERLSLSQPAVSKTLSELEAIVGARLVERSKAGRRGVQGLAPAGEQLLAHVLRVLEALDASAEAVAPAAGGRIERLRIGAQAREVVVKMADWAYLALTVGDKNHPDYPGPRCCRCRSRGCASAGPRCRWW